MIFVTVGTQLPFDRLVRCVDDWAGASGSDVFAQMGPSRLRPRHIGYRDFLSPQESHERMLEAEVIVAHAGMGTILSAFELGKPLLIMPRHAAFGEQRNDHQVATARHFAQTGEVTVAFDVDELRADLDDLEHLAVHEPIGPYASAELIAALRAFITDGVRVPHAALRLPQRAEHAPIRAGRFRRRANRDRVPPTARSRS